MTLATRRLVENKEIGQVDKCRSRLLVLEGPVQLTQ